MPISRLESSNNNTTMDLFCHRILRAAPIFASGHGRTVELLLESVVDKSTEWNNAERSLWGDNSMKVLTELVKLSCLNYVGYPKNAIDRRMVHLPQLQDVKNDLEF
jgi:hypothetical protein